MPSLFILENLAKDRKKYKMMIDDSFKAEDIKEFYNAFKEGSLVEYLIS